MYKITTVEDLGTRKVLTLEGVPHKVSVWATDYNKNPNPVYALCMEGATIDATVKETAKDGKVFYNLVASNTGAPRASQGYAKGGADIAKAQERKREDIEHAQVRKEDSIKMSSTMRDAVLIALAEVGNMADHEKYARRILYWRKWLLDNWEPQEPVDDVSYTYGGIEYPKGPEGVPFE